MKNTLIFLICYLISIASQATTYQIANQTQFDSFNWSLLVAGDNVQFAKGQTFYGTITISQSGTSGNPIIYGSYGTGANPIITGFTTVTAWTNLGSNIWESTNAVSTLSVCNVVSINGINTPMGKYPNEGDTNLGYIFYETYTGGTSLTSSSLTGTPDWTGAEVVIRSNQYILERRIITSQTGGTLNWSGNVSLANGQPFFIQNDSKTLDQQNEWYYNPTTKKLRIYSTTQPVNVQVASVEKLMEISNSVQYITVDGVDFKGANVNAIYRWPFGSEGERAKHITIKNNSISYTGEAAISARIDYFNIDNVSINYSNGNGINIAYSKRSSVKNCSIFNTAIFKGMTQGWGATSALNISNCINVLVENNSIVNCGYDGVNFSDITTDSITIRNNYIDKFCLVLNDGGAIYGNRNAKIYNNIISNGGLGQIKLWVYDPWAVGIYLDDNSFNNEVYNNTVYNCNRVGLYLHNSRDNNIHHNLIYHNRVWQLYTSDNQNTTYPFQNNTITDNVFVGLPDDNVVSKYQYGTSGEQVGTINRNIYARPINSGYSTLVECEGSFYTTFSNWQSFSGQDANSKISPVSVSSVNDIQFIYNETNATKIVALNNPSVDMNGTKYVGSITLQPYTSAIYLKDPNPATPAPSNRRHPVKIGTNYYKSGGYYYTL